MSSSVLPVPSKLLSRRDLNFLLYEWLNVLSLTERERYADHSAETFDSALDTCEKIATDHFYSINKLLDQDEPRFEQGKVITPAPLKVALKAFVDAGLMAAGQNYELGGMQLPYTLEKACFAYFNAASVSAGAYPFLTMGNANLLLAHGSKHQIETWAKPELAGRYFGTMCLSEPQAGSSLSDIRTRAELQSDATYRLYGNKMWISGGDQDLSENIVHLVLAKIPGADSKLIPGVKGISLFVVPKVLVNAQGELGERNDVVLAGLNHKMGYRGTTNCLLNFGEGSFKPRSSGLEFSGSPSEAKAGAIGYLVGEPHRGLQYMFHMMNEARIGVGLGATTLGYTAYLHALEYARARPQGRPAKGKDPAAAQVPIVQHADVRRMLLTQKAYVEGALALNLFCSMLVDEQGTGTNQALVEEAGLLLELLTPIAKSWPSQWCQEANSMAIQVHGGYGYTRDYNVEQYYRDQRLNPIHEGSHGIQGLDLLGRKVVMNNGAALKAFSLRVAATCQRGRALGPEFATWADQLFAWAIRIDQTIAVLYSAVDLDVTLANASIFLEAFGHYTLAWIWLEQGIVAQAKSNQSNIDRDFYNGKLQATRYFMIWELPKIGPMLALLDGLDQTTLKMQDAWF
jgi:alkylation response protein AidB-like acyl-CoA dehydrogenase